MGETAKKPGSETGDLERKIVTHPAFQRVIESASSKSEGFHEALAEVETHYNAMETENGRLRQELEKTRQALERAEKERERYRPLAIRDGLTGAYNHLYFQEQLETEIKRSGRSGRPVSLIMMDLDYFKMFNDNYGHQAGDYVLKELNKIAGKVLRESDIFARYGGEEFAVILPDTDEKKAEEVAERLRKAVENAGMTYKGQKLEVTLSLGVISEKTESADDIITKADNLLYTAKDLGRNCVVSRNFLEDELDIDLSLYGSEKQ